MRVLAGRLGSAGSQPRIGPALVEYERQQRSQSGMRHQDDRVHRVTNEDLTNVLNLAREMDDRTPEEQASVERLERQSESMPDTCARSSGNAERQGSRQSHCLSMTWTP